MSPKVSLSPQSIPIPLWKTLNNTISQLRNISSKDPDQFINSLAKIIKTNPTLFVFPHNLKLTPEENQMMVRKTKSLTTWTLGGFFQFLTCDYLKKHHDILVNIQLCILNYIYKKNYQYYNDIANEYYKAFQQLIDFIKSEQDESNLNVFQMEIFQDLRKEIEYNSILLIVRKQNAAQLCFNVLGIVEMLLVNESRCNKFTNLAITIVLDELIYLIAEKHMDLKLKASQIFINLIGEQEKYSNKRVKDKFITFSLYFEQLVYQIFTRSNQLSSEEKKLFENLLNAFIMNDWCRRQCPNVAKYVLNNLNSDIALNENLPLVFYGSSADDIDQISNLALANLSVLFLPQLKHEIKMEIIANSNMEKVNLIDKQISPKWALFSSKLTSAKRPCSNYECNAWKLLNFFKKLTDNIAQLKIEFKNRQHLIFFDYIDTLFHIIIELNQHFINCTKLIQVNAIFDFLLNFAFISNENQTLSIIFDLFTFSHSKKTQNYNDLMALENWAKYQKELDTFFHNLHQLHIDRQLNFDYFMKFTQMLSSGLINFNNYIEHIESIFFKIYQKDDVAILKYLPDLFTLFPNTSKLHSEILLPCLTHSNPMVLCATFQSLARLICMSSQDFVKSVHTNLNTEMICLKCSKNTTAFNSVASKIELDLQPEFIIKCILNTFKSNNTELVVSAINVLPSCANHIDKFNMEMVMQHWLNSCSNGNETVTKELLTIILTIIKNNQNPLSDQDLAVYFSFLRQLSNKSLREKNKTVQLSIMTILREIKKMKEDKMLVKVFVNLLYFMMMPTSHVKKVATKEIVSILKLKKNPSIPKHFYMQNKHEICQAIADLCFIRKRLRNESIHSSLESIVVIIDYYSPKEFVSRQCDTLLPYFLSKQIRFNQDDLMAEIADLIQTDLIELLSTMYANIFLYAFLNESKDNFKKTMTYLETKTKISGPVLRKTHVWPILNELILSFHEKRDKVLLALSLFAKEDDDLCIQNYLHSRLMGILKHFDMKLIAQQSTINKRLILHSLADLFEYVGSINLTPIRFKVIAMLRTSDYYAYPHEIARVWKAFIRNCDMELIGPQLAIVFVSLLPLLDTCPEEINAIFHYLLVENEKHTKDSIKDLFFVNDARINNTISSVIKKYVLDNGALKQKICNFLRYLNHESFQVRVHSLKHLKYAMEANRKELDEMILSYNGIDQTIIDLIDKLTSMCREKEELCRLAVADVFGELGAVEPAHLPRRYSHNCRFFSFYIDDDGFIQNALSELALALQNEKNTVYIDRFAVAIQELLKNNNISPVETSEKFHIWQSFAPHLQQIMLPFVDSRYIIKKLPQKMCRIPIYGSDDGTTCDMWLINWTQTLITCLNEKHQKLLEDCLPAIRQHRRTLMQFLPHIALHAIIDNYTNKEQVYGEMMAIIKCFDAQREPLTAQLLDVRPCFHRSHADYINNSSNEANHLAQCAKVVYIILDFFDRWLLEWQWQTGLNGRNDLNLKNLTNFVSRFCKLELAKSNYICTEYPRALIYLEDYLATHPHELSSNLAFLAQIYSQLNECDGVEGVMALQTSEPSLDERILALETSNKLAEAMTFYEQIPTPLTLEHLGGLYRCYMDLDNVNTALHFVRGLNDNDDSPMFEDLIEMQAEALWRLGQFEQLNEVLNEAKNVDTQTWGIEIGRALIAFQNRNHAQFQGILNNLKLQQIRAIAATSLEQGVYQQGYTFIAKCHALIELEKIAKITQDLSGNNGYPEQRIKDLENEFELRIRVVQESIRIKEPILCLRRVGIEQAKRVVGNGARKHFDNLLGECWILSGKTARTTGIYQQAYTYNLRAESYAPDKLFLEKAKLHWMREEHAQALRILQRGVEELMANGTQAMSMGQRKICAEAKLLIATYNESIANVDTDISVGHYKEAMEVCKEWETGLVSLGRFYDRIFETMSDSDRDNSKGSDLQIHIINYFGKSLQYGTKFVYQSMPRLLSIWFDYGTRLLDVESGREERKTNLLKMTKLIDNFLERLPSYVFLTAFSQLVSRICHPQKEVYKELTSIIIKLLLKYPQQTLWMLISVIKSSYMVRGKRCADMLNDARLKSAAPIMKMIKDFTNLAEKLIELCNKPIAKDVTSAKISQLLRNLPRLFSRDFSEIMVPTHIFRKLVLPNPDFSHSQQQHNPFPNDYVYIVGIEEEVVVLNSLQKPRKITFRASNGKHYSQLLKANDDLRKDFRLMEFNDIVNQLLSQEAESRQRRLHIRLYSVVPLNEECGLIEWIPNLVGLRPILTSIYKQRGQGMNPREIKEAICHLRDPISKKRQVFTNILLARHPAVLGDWFRRTFPDAQSWFFARQAYTRTTAVMSMVGYIFGLGDRHGENILFDSICGDTVHVDFNCLFNKGETFEWPERVPFRLTHNMIAAMGPLGVEGVYRKCCACTLRVLRTNANTLMSIVTPFVYDPLVSWPRNVPASAQNTAERTNEKAVDYIKNIQLRLQGQIKTKSRAFSIPLSVDGQTDNLIKEAKSLDNLCQMYVGWGPYL